MSERMAKVALTAGGLLFLPLFPYLAYTRPEYFTSPSYLGGFILLGFWLISVWLYRQAFLPIVLVALLLAGLTLPVGLAIWVAARWFFVATGALAGCFVMLKERQLFGLSHTPAMSFSRSWRPSLLRQGLPGIAPSR